MKVKMDLEKLKVSDSDIGLHWSSEELVPAFPPILKQVRVEEGRRTGAHAKRVRRHPSNTFLPKVRGSYHIATAWGEKGELGRKHVNFGGKVKVAH